MQLQNQIFSRLVVNLVNLIPNGAHYDGSGNFSINITVGKTYQLVFGGFDLTASNGAQNFTPLPSSFTFTATAVALNLIGNGPTLLVTAQLYQLN